MAAVLKDGKSGDEVRVLQEKLQKLGYDVSNDGNFGALTKWAVTNVQAMFGYSVDGIAGPATIGLIDQQLGYGWNAKSPEAQANALKSQGLA